jgi:hypothetical protein
MKNISVSTTPPFKKMKKTFFIILVMFTMVSIQNLQAQQTYNVPITSDKTIEIIGEFTYEDKDGNNRTYVNIEENKLVQWHWQTGIYNGAKVYYWSETYVNFYDIIPSKLELFEGNGFTNINFGFKEEGNSPQFEAYVGEELITKGRGSKFFNIKFKTKPEAEVFMAKLKKAMEN